MRVHPVVMVALGVLAFATIAAADTITVFAAASLNTTSFISSTRKPRGQELLPGLTRMPPLASLNIITNGPNERGQSSISIQGGDLVSSWHEPWYRSPF